MYLRRKHPRLKDYDDSQSGYYFVTVCSNKRRNLFSCVVGRGLAPAEIRLTECGKIIENELLRLTERYPHVSIDKYVIMPNHFHAIIAIGETAGASPRPTLCNIICAFKSLATRECRKQYPDLQVFQTSYYEHVIRGDTDYREDWEYIENNPARWMEDDYYLQGNDDLPHIK